MALYTETYWKKTSNVIEFFIPSNIVSVCIIPKVYINLELFRSDVLKYLLRKAQKPIPHSKYVHPLVLLGTTSNRREWEKRMIILIQELDYNELSQIKNNCPSPIHLFHYFCWKKQRFSSSYHIPRKPLDKKVLWGYEKAKTINYYDMITMVFPREEKGREVVQGIVNFDDEPYEGKQRHIGLVNDDYKKIEVFHVSTLDNVQLYVKKEINDIFTKTIQGIPYYFNFSDPVEPWNILPNGFYYVTYKDKNGDRNFKTYKFLHQIDRDFTRWYVISKYGDKKNFNLKNVLYPMIYKIRESIFINHYANFIEINCIVRPIIKYGFEETILYTIVFNSDEDMKDNLPKLITTTILGNLGKSLVINDNIITITSFPFDKNIEKNKIISSFVKKLKRITSSKKIEIFNSQENVTLVLH